MISGRICAVAIVVFFTSANMVHAAGKNPALDEISTFADKLCGSETALSDLKGSSSKLELSVSAKADLSSLLKKLIGLGVEVKAGGAKTNYEGVLQADLPKVLNDKRTCRLQVLKVLQQGVGSSKSNNLAFFKSASISYTNMGEFRTLDRGIFISEVLRRMQPTSTINGVGISISKLEFDTHRKLKRVSLFVAPPNEETISRTVAIGEPFQLKTQACSQIIVNPQRATFSHDSGTSPPRNDPIFDSRGVVMCTGAIYKCSILISVQAECAGAPNT